MRTKLMYGLLPLACIALGACGMGKGKEPTGQVVATVDGDEITVTELRAELAGVSLPDPKARKAAEQQALQMIINRKIIANAAEEQKLDKTPEFAVQEQRAMDSLRADALQKKVVNAVPAPSREEATRYMAANPHLFGERKIFVVNQIRMAAPSDPAIMKEFQPLKTLDEVEAMLKAKGIRYQRGNGAIDALTVNPRLVDAIVKLPPGEVFVIPSRGVVIISEVRETQVQPFTGEPAVKYAINSIKSQRTEQALSKEFSRVVASAQSTVKYNKLYQPPAKAAPGKAPAGKAAPATPKA